MPLFDKPIGHPAGWRLLLAGLLAIAASSVAQAAPKPVPTDPLDTYAAPIALYPDRLVAQVMAAAAAPLEVRAARAWLQQHLALRGAALVEAVEQQPWRPGVKALTTFPSVLAMMDDHLYWTALLGRSAASQPQAMLAAIQTMRGRARRVDHLASTPEQVVATEGSSITVQPRDPVVVYVPDYDPWLSYGAPITPVPGWAAAAPGPGRVYFGLGVGLAASAEAHYGWRHWAIDWRDQAVLFDHRRVATERRPLPSPVGSHVGQPPEPPLVRLPSANASAAYPEAHLSELPSLASPPGYAPIKLAPLAPAPFGSQPLDPGLHAGFIPAARGAGPALGR